MVKTIITIFLLGITTLTYSQTEKIIKRKGVIFGTSYGIGSIFQSFPDKKQNDVGFSLELKLGYMLRPNLALLISSNVSIYDYSGFGRDRKRDFGVLAPSVQYWINDKLWVSGGVGLGGDNPVFWDIKNPDTDPLETKYYNGLGLVTSVGYEVYQKGNFSLDLKTRISYRNVELQEGKTNGLAIAILFGINFY
jgi:hypothetical protein